MRRRGTVAEWSPLGAVFARVTDLAFGAGSSVVARREGHAWMCGVEIGVEVLAFFFRGVLARVRGLVFEHLDEFVETGREEGSEDGPDPVDPVVGVELV